MIDIIFQLSLTLLTSVAKIHKDSMAQVKPCDCYTNERLFSLLGSQSFTPFGGRQMASVFHGLSPYLPLAPGGVGGKKFGERL